MQRNDLYIGIPEQQSKTQEHLQSAVLKRKSGIYLVSGGIRSGKTSIVRKFKEENKLSQSIPMFAGYDQTLNEYGLLVERGAKNGSHILLTTAEISDTNSESLRALHHIVETEIKNGYTIQVIGDIVTKRFPAWNSRGNNKHIANILKAFFEPEILNLYPLDSNPNKLAEGVWEIIHTETPQMWGNIVEELGFPSAYSQFWEQLPQSRNEFVANLLQKMIHHPLGNLEGQTKRGKEY